MVLPEHPRARGENVTLPAGVAGGTGTSPRTRGKLATIEMTNAGFRNIPAHAGKTAGPGVIPRVFQEHPRARGENREKSHTASTRGGTSPRTRGKPLFERHVTPESRNIPAHAGKTISTSACKSLCSEHPRARGENHPTTGSSPALTGTSPRTRGKRLLTCGSSFLKVILHSVLFSRTMGV